MPTCKASDSVKASDLCWKSVDKGSRDAKEVRQALANGYIDYVCEDCIKADFSDKRCLKKDASLFEAYDSDAGDRTQGQRTDRMVK